MLLTGKIHKHKHPNFLLKGEVLVLTETGGSEVLKAPLSMISEPGTKRALYAITDLVWTTIHHNPTNTEDLKELEKIVIAKDYEEYDKNNIVYRTEYKRQWMEDFVKCHKNSIPWNKIKYFK